MRLIRIISKISTMVSATKERQDTAVGFDLVGEDFLQRAYLPTSNIYL